MKTLFISILLLISVYSWADSISIGTVAIEPSAPMTYASQDTRLQYNHGDKKYVFLAFEQMHICPDYCGVTYNLYGIGLGNHIKFDKVSLFIQGGFYYVKNNVGYQRNNENLYYYMINRFNGGRSMSFTGYRVDNGNALGAEIGLDVPLSQDFSFQFYYRHLQFWTNTVAYLNGGYWHDPATIKYNGYGMNLAYHF